MTDISLESKLQVLDAVLGAGWSVVPVCNKIPAITGWPDQPMCHPIAVKGWASQHQEHDWAVHPGKSGLIVIDVDEPEGFETLQELMNVFGPLPDSPVMRTPSGGAHVYFRAATDRLRAWIGPGLEVKRGSLLATFLGHGREVLSEQRPWEGALPALSGPWVDALQYKDRPDPPKVKPIASIDRYAYLRVAQRNEIRKIQNAHKGERNRVLYCAAAALGRFVRAGELHRDETASLLFKAARWVGLDADEAKGTIASGLRGQSHG